MLNGKEPRPKAHGIELSQRLALRPAEAAEALGVCERTLRRLAPELPRVIRGGLVLYPVAGLQHWLKQHARASESEIDQSVRKELDALSRRR